MKIHGRNIVHISRVGLRYAQCMRCKHEADLCDEQDHEFALCEGCLLAWDIKQSGLADEWSPGMAKHYWRAFYDAGFRRADKKQAEQYLRELTKALAEAESRRWNVRGAVS